MKSFLKTLGIFLIIPVLILCLVKGCNYAAVHGGDVEFAPLLEKYIKNGKTPATEFLNDLFPNEDLSQYDIVCSGGSTYDGFTPMERVILKMDHITDKNFSLYYKEAFLLYPPYYIFISDKEQKNVKHVSINYYDGLINYYEPSDDRYIDYIGGSILNGCYDIKDSYFDAGRSKNTVGFDLVSKNS